jgi:ketosteroid isomerase-like protein
MSRTYQFVLIVALLAGAPATAMAQHAAHHAASDSARVAATVEQFHAALSAGDSAAALALLADDVMILESGGVETRNEYRSHHLPGDIAFARAVKSERTLLQLRVQGDVAWVSSSSATRGTYRERPIDSLGAELMVLRRSGDRWLISSIHWSSRRRPS